MTTSDWIILGSTILLLGGIGVSLFLGLRSLNQTKNIQKKELSHRLLNEIAEWAIRVTTWRAENRKVFTEMARIGEGQVRQTKRLMHAHLAEVLDFFSAITGLNTYVNKVSLTFQQGLPEDVQQLVKDLEEFTNFLNEWKTKLATEIAEGKDDTIIDTDAIWGEELTLKVAKSAGAVLERVADIKATEID